MDALPKPRLRIAVLGAGGRAGRAAVEEAHARGHRVVAIVRDPQRYPDLARERITVVRGDALDPGSVVAATAGCDAIVAAVTPFTAPPDSFEGFDASYYERVADGLIAAGQGGARRILVVSLFATLDLPDGRPVFDDSRAFPAELRPFAAAHAAGTARLTASDPDVDWLALAPPPQLIPGGPRTGHYRLGDHTVDLATEASLSYADLAIAILDEIERPTRHREHIAVSGVSTATPAR